MKLKVKYSGEEVLALAYCGENQPVGEGEFLHDVFIETPDQGIDLAKKDHYRVVGGKLTMKSQVEIDSLEKFKTIERQRAVKILELTTEYQRRIDAMFGTDMRAKVFQLGEALSIKNKIDSGKPLKKESDAQKLEAMEALFDLARDIQDAMLASKAWLEDAARTAEELNTFNAATSPAWPQ